MFIDIYKNKSPEELRLEYYERFNNMALRRVEKSGTLVKFNSTRIKSIDKIMKNDIWTDLLYVRLQCITCMEVYENMSLEELRLEDYYRLPFRFQQLRSPIYASSSDNFGAKSFGVKSSQLGQNFNASRLKASAWERRNADITLVSRATPPLKSFNMKDYLEFSKNPNKKCLNPPSADSLDARWSGASRDAKPSTSFDKVRTLQKSDSTFDIAETMKNNLPHIELKEAMSKREQGICSSRNLRSDNEMDLVATSPTKSPAVIERNNVKPVATDRIDKDVINVFKSYDERCKKSYLVVYEGTHCQGIPKAKRRLIFLVHLHNDDPQDINQWCRNILGNPQLMRRINSHAVFWSCNVTSDGDDSKLARVLNASTCSFRNIFVVNDFTKSPGYQMKDLAFLSLLTQLSAELPDNIFERYAIIWTEAVQIKNALLALYDSECGIAERSAVQSLRDKLDKSFAKAFSALQERHRESEIEYKIRQNEGAETMKELDEQETDIESIQLGKELNAKKVALEPEIPAIHHECVIESGSKESTQDQACKESLLTHIGRNVFKIFETNLKHFIAREAIFYYLF